MLRCFRFLKIFLSKFHRKKENGYNYIISLGYNCEVAYRFLKFFRFEESSLFNWTYSKTIDDLISTLNNFEELGKNSFHLPNPLWECKNTHIRFHGKCDMSMCIKNTENEKILEEDLKDLEGRIQYLKKKFTDIAQNDESKLYIYKIKKEDITGDIEDKLLNLHKALVKIGANNFKLLIVSEETAGTIPNNPLYITRTVKYFAPNDNVTSKKCFNNGWDDIYAEFYQNKRHKKPRKKQYKFER